MHECFDWEDSIPRDLAFDGVREWGYDTSPKMKRMLANVLLSLLLGLAGGLPMVFAQGIPRSHSAPINFSSPRVEVQASTLTNLSANTSKKNNLRNLDEQLKAPFNIMDASGDVAGQNMPMPLVSKPVLSTKAAKELKARREEREQWMFGSPEELEADRQNAARMMGVTEYEDDGTEKGTKPLVQRYWDRLDRERAGPTNSMSADAATDKSDREIKEQARVLFGGLNLPTEESKPSTEASAATLAIGANSANNSSLGQEATSLRSGNDFFGNVPQNSASFSGPKSEASLNRMSEFRQLLDKSTPSPASSLGAFTTPAYSRPAVDFSASSPSTFRSPVLSPSASFDSLGGSSFGKSSFAAPSYSLNPPPPPVYQAPRVATPPSGFQIPKRVF